MNTKSLEACLGQAAKISHSVEEYEFLSNLATVIVNDFAYKADDAGFNLTTDDGLKAIDYLSKGKGIALSSNNILDWFVFYLFARRYHQDDEQNSKIPTIDYNNPWRTKAGFNEEKITSHLNFATDSLISWLDTRPLVKQNVHMFISAIDLSQNFPGARKHLVSHALHWLFRHLITTEIDFTSNSPVERGRQGSVDGLSVGGDLESFVEESQTGRSDGVSAQQWAKIVMAATGALFDEKVSKKSVEQLRISMEELIVTCISDPQEEIRNLATKRVQTFFKRAPLSLSALFCLSWVETARQLQPVNWVKMEGILKLIQVFLEKLPSPPDALQEEKKSVNAMLKQRLSVVFLMKKEQEEYAPNFDRRHSQPTSAEEEKVKRVLLPNIRNLTLGLLSSHRLPIRQLAVEIYITCVKSMHLENQAKILENALSTLGQDVSNRLDEFHRNRTSTKPKLSQYLVESLTTISANITKPSIKSYCQMDWIQVAALCDALLSHPSSRVRDSAADLLVAILGIVKSSVEMTRALMIALTQTWISHQDMLFMPFTQLSQLPKYSPEYEDRSKETRMAWRSGHLLAFTKINRMILEEYQVNYDTPIKPKKSVLSPLFDNARRFSLSGTKPGSMFRKKLEVNEAAPLLVRLKQLETTELRQVIWNVRSASNANRDRAFSVDTAFSDSMSMASSSGVSSAASSNGSMSVSNGGNNNFRTCLTVILHAGVECTCDPSSQVRSLAREALMEVAQVIGLFDHTLLVNIVMTHMSFEPTLLTYGCLEVLLNILINLKSGKVGNTCLALSQSKACVQLSPRLLFCLLNADRSRVWLRSCAHYVGDREIFDAVTLNAVQVVMCALTSVHHLGPLSVRLSQLSMEALTEESGEDLAEEDAHSRRNSDERDRDQGFEEDRQSSSPEAEGQLDLDVDALIHAIDSLKALIDRLSSSLNARKTNANAFGWIPDSPTKHRKSTSGTFYVASNVEVSLEFAFLLLRRIEIPLQTYLCCASKRSLSKLPCHLQPMNSETVAVALSALVFPLARLAFEMYMPVFLIKRENSIGGMPPSPYIEALREKCMVSIINVIGIITHCLPKAPVLGISTDGIVRQPRNSYSVVVQGTVGRLECQVTAAAQMQETCGKFIGVVTDIFNFARRNLYPQSFLRSSQWWWMGHLISSLPSLCEATPGQIDASFLVELLCNELASQYPNLGPVSTSPTSSNRSSNLSDSRRRRQLLPSKVHPPTLSHGGGGQITWIRVREASVVEANTGDPLCRRTNSTEEATGKSDQELSDDEDSTGMNASLSTSSSGCECDPSEKTKLDDKSSSTSGDSLRLSKHDFPPLSPQETSTLVAKLIKCCDARTIEPLKNIIPREIIACARQMLERECAT